MVSPNEAPSGDNSASSLELPTEFAVSGENRYVAFCDILGFSNRIFNDFTGTAKLYQEFANFILKSKFSAEATIYSDAIMLNSEDLGSIVGAVNALWFIAQTHFFVIRGGIAYGRYWEQRIDGNVIVVSDTLVRAVKLEKDARYPMVVLADDIDIPLGAWVRRFRDGPIAAPLLHFRDRNIVNPFGPMWFASASGRIMQLMQDSPGYQDKYRWLLALHEAISQQHNLVPSQVVEELLKMGIISRKI
jgi:hypothetical protein